MVAVLILVIVLMVVVAFSDGEMTRGWGEKRRRDDEANTRMMMQAYEAGMRDGLRRQHRPTQRAEPPNAELYERGADGVYRPRQAQ